MALCWPNVVEIHVHGFTKQCRPTVISTHYLSIYSTPQHNKEVLHKMFYSLLLHLGAIKLGKNSNLEPNWVITQIYVF